MEQKERKIFLQRFWGPSVVVILIFAIFGFNLWRLQVVKGQYYAQLAQGNSMQMVPVIPNRGDIIDAKGGILATSIPQFDLTLDWLALQNMKSDNWKNVVGRLAYYLKPYWPLEGETEELIKEDILSMIQNHQWEHYRTISILSGVSKELQAVIAEHADELTGVSVEAMPVRYYPENNLAGQVLGYVREIAQSEIKQFN